MSIPQSKKLQAEEKENANVKPKQIIVPEEVETGPIKLTEVPCFNDFVAILQTKFETSLVVDESQAYKNEGLVVGVGPGLSDGNGGRLKPSVDIGEYVMFGGRNIIATIEPAAGSYKNKKVIIVSEKNLLCKLPTTIKYELV